MKDFGDLYKSEKKKIKNPKSSKEEIINQAIKFHSKGNIAAATKYYQQLINQGCIDHRIFCNYGLILKGLGDLQEAEIYLRKAIKLQPDSAEACDNLGMILRDIRKIDEAEMYLRKAIKLKPDFAEAFNNLGIILRDIGKIDEAEIYLRKAIKLKPHFAKAHLNLGMISKDLGKLLEAELSTRNAIKLKPDFAEAHLNLGNIFRDIGNLKEAEISTRKAIEFNPNLAKAHYSLSLIKLSDDHKIWQDQLFSENILNNKSQDDKIDIYFARSNFLHKEKNYEESSKYLQLANNLKLDLNQSCSEAMINKSSKLKLESEKKEINKKRPKNFSESIFIVGMPRSGSTLLESILSMNNEVYDLGEINILEESFLEYEKTIKDISLADLYEEKVKNKTAMNITTNKWLYNYQYAGIIAGQIPNAKIIHCFRNPLDNILSIYRAHFNKGNEYSSSLVDCARVYLDQEEIMKKYKKRFRSKIYDLNYNLLVSNPKKEIKSLISWLGWKWQDSFLSPELNTRSVSTASSVQVRFPINSKSIDAWKNYKEMLKPAIKILTKTNKHKDINS